MLNLVAQWKRAKEVKLAVLTCSVFCGAVFAFGVWVVLSYRYGAKDERIAQLIQDRDHYKEEAAQRPGEAAKDQRIALLTQERDLYKQEADQKPQLLATIKELKAEAEAKSRIEWPALSPQQIKELADICAKHSVSMLSIMWSPDVDGVQFFRSAREAEKLASVKVSAFAGGGFSDRGMRIRGRADAVEPIRQLLSPVAKNIEVSMTDQPEGDRPSQVMITLGER